ncbi:hypothetical protein D3C81_1674090 [compost metagenome]
MATTSTGKQHHEQAHKENTASSNFPAPTLPYNPDNIVSYKSLPSYLWINYYYTTMKKGDRVTIHYEGMQQGSDVKVVDTVETLLLGIFSGILKDDIGRGAKLWATITSGDSTVNSQMLTIEVVE